MTVCRECVHVLSTCQTGLTGHTHYSVVKVYNEGDLDKLVIPVYTPTCYCFSKLVCPVLIDNDLINIPTSEGVIH